MGVYVNDRKIGSVRAGNYNVNTLEEKVWMRNGENTVVLVGEGTSDGMGMSVDNVKLMPNVP